MGKDKATQVCGIYYSFGLLAIKLSCSGQKKKYAWHESHLFYDPSIWTAQGDNSLDTVEISGGHGLEGEGVGSDCKCPGIRQWWQVPNSEYTKTTDLRTLNGWIGGMWLTSQ